MFRNVSEQTSTTRPQIAEIGRLTPTGRLCNGSGNVFGPREQIASRWGEKGQPMRRSLRSIRWLAALAGAGCAATTLLTSAAPAAVDGAGVARATAAHRCLVMTGSGEPAFVKNFNPYTATGQPSGTFRAGASLCVSWCTPLSESQLNT